MYLAGAFVIDLLGRQGLGGEGRKGNFGLQSGHPLRGLQGFLQIRQAHLTAVLSHLEDDGVLLEFIAGIPRLHGELLRDGFRRVLDGGIIQGDIIGSPVCG